MGALPSPPDARDFVLPASAAATVAGASSGLTSFRLGNRPPITNQGVTSQCVAYSTAYEQNWQDKVDSGQFYNFDEATFFRRIGGIEGVGAFARAALDELVSDGYPEQDSTPQARQHQARLYARVINSVQSVKDAIVACGGVLGVGPWYPNWTDRHGDLQVLPAPSGGGSGHEVWYIGWDQYGIIGQNSWGSLWGDGGLFRMPWIYFVDRMSEVWTTVDERTSAVLYNRARINNIDVRIRQERTLTATELRPGQIWADTRPAGIRRRRDGAIVATPYNRWFRFGGLRIGPEHGIGKRPRTWARLRIANGWRVVPAPFVTIDYA